MAAEASFSTEIDSMSAGLTSLMLYSTPSSRTSGLALLSVLTPRMRIVPPSEPGLALFWLIHTPGVLYIACVVLVMGWLAFSFMSIVATEPVRFTRFTVP